MARRDKGVMRLAEDVREKIEEMLSAGVATQATIAVTCGCSQASVSRVKVHMSVTRKVPASSAAVTDIADDLAAQMDAALKDTR